MHSTIRHLKPWCIFMNSRVYGRKNCILERKTFRTLWRERKVIIFFLFRWMNLMNGTCNTWSFNLNLAYTKWLSTLRIKKDFIRVITLGKESSYRVLYRVRNGLMVKYKAFESSQDYLCGGKTCISNTHPLILLFLFFSTPPWYIFKILHSLHQNLLLLM